MHKYPESMKKANLNPLSNSPGITRSFKIKLSSRLQQKELFYLIDNEGIKGITTNI